MEFAKLMETRRSVNFFDASKQVSDEDLKKMVAFASLAPSSFNLQPWNMIVVRSPEAKARLRKVAFDQPKVTEASVMLILLADMEAYKEENPTVEEVWESWLKNGYMKPAQKGYFIDTCKKLYADPMSLPFAVKNTAFFAMGLMLAAKELGLDTHPMDGFDYRGVIKEFSIAPNFFVPMLLAVGYFDASKKLLPRNWRKPYQEIVISSV